MATSTIPAKSEIKQIYSGPGYQNNIGATLTLEDNVKNYKMLRLIVFGTTAAATNRTIIAIPNFYNEAYSAQFPLACNAENGSARIQFEGNSIKVLSSTYTALYIGAIYGEK